MGRLDGRSLSTQYLALWVWVLGTLMLGFFQASRIVAFGRRLRDAVPAPTWLVEEAQQLGEQLEVRVPELLVVPGLGTPMLWCLGRPKLLLPGHLIKSIEPIAGGEFSLTSWLTSDVGTTGWVVSS